MTTYKRPEVLAPAGTLEKLKIAIQYGADAVYIGGEVFGLRTRAGNFSYEEIAEGVEFAHARGAKVYVAANMVTHEGALDGASEFFAKLAEIGVDGTIISDPALIEIALNTLRGTATEVHLSTQASAINGETLNFWKRHGLTRAVLGREVSFDEIAKIRAKTDLEIEVFIHGAMCISYSGRCVLSNHMSLRDANRGGCSQSCRWRYDIYGDGELLNEKGDVNEQFSMSAVDMCMIKYVDQFIKLGMDSLKIEGRMKSIHYVSTVTNVYKKAVDSFMEDPENWVCKQEWIDELWKVAQREMSTGFYLHDPAVEEQLFGERRKRPEYSFIGEVLAYDEAKGIAHIRQRNNFSAGDTIEFYGPGFVHFTQLAQDMKDKDGEELDYCPHPMMELWMPVAQKVEPGFMIRKMGQTDHGNP
ncbi:MAG: U32 family peptidase [Lactobacillales bacterium]|jgi:putative protease|nr:U32 family peptidase [Lactobacillales bacterium]